MNDDWRAQGMGEYSRLSYEDSKTLPYQLFFKKVGFPKVCADWCEINCIGDWGWYFVKALEKSKVSIDDVYIGFEHQSEMFMFQIYWAERFVRR